MNKLVISLLLASCLLLVNLPLVAQTQPAPTKSAQALPDNVPGLLRKANEAYAAKDYPTFRDAMAGLHRMRPYNSNYMYQLVMAHALLDEKSKAYDLMLRMQQQGLAYDFNDSDNTINIRGTEVYDYVNDLMKLAGDPMGESEPVFVLPDTVVMPATISWDESRRKFLIGTIAEGSILAVGLDGQVSELLRANDENGLWAVLDINVDQARNRLWVSSASLPGFSGFDPVDKGRSALFEFNLETLELVHRYPVPVDGQAHILGSMALSPKGDIFIADRNLPIIYYKAADEQKLKAIMGLKDMISMRGVAMQPDGRLMYIADREMGIAVVDVESGRHGMLAVPATLNLGAIDGLSLKDNNLFVIQNGISPQRVMRLQLDASGTQVADVAPVAVAQPEFDYPTYGTLQGENLYYFANSQLSGSEKQKKSVVVLRSPLTSGKELVQPNMKLFLETQAKAEKQRAEKQKAEEQEPEKD